MLLEEPDSYLNIEFANLKIICNNKGKQTVGEGIGKKCGF